MWDAILSAVGATAGPPDKDPAETAAPPALPPLQVLLAEDSLANQRLTVDLLEKDGHTVTVAKNGAEAVEAAIAAPFDVILMDLQMPEMDGFEAAQAIRRRERETQAPPTPIVALTARTTQADVERCRMVGMDGYLSKPFRRAQLFEIIARHVGTGLAGAPGRDSARNVGRLDWKAALATVDGDRDLLCSVLHAFLTQYPSLVIELRKGLEGGDAPTLRRARTYARRFTSDVRRRRRGREGERSRSTVPGRSCR